MNEKTFKIGDLRVISVNYVTVWHNSSQDCAAVLGKLHTGDFVVFLEHAITHAEHVQSSKVFTKFGCGFIVFESSMETLLLRLKKQSHDL